MKVILGSHFTSKDVNYQKLVYMRNSSDKTYLKKN